MIFTPRLLIIGGVAAALAVTAGGLYYKGRSAQAALDKAAVAASQAQARVSDVVTKALDTHTTQTIIVRERADRVIETVRSAPGANDLLPPDLRDAYLRGMQQLETGAVGDNRPIEPAVPVPAT